MEEEQREALRLAVIHFEDLPDPRVERSKQHALVNVVAVALSAVIAGAESFYEIEAFGKTKRAWLAQFLELEKLSLLDLAGCIVTVDALNTQREVARKVKQHEAEYVIQSSWTNGGA